MIRTNVRLKKQPDKINGEDQVVIKIQYQQKQYPIPVPHIKVLPEYFTEKQYGEWLKESYTNQEGIHRKKTTVNNQIKQFKTRIDTALENLEEVGFDEMSVQLVKRSIGKSPSELKKQIKYLVDPFYEESVLDILEKEYLKDVFIGNSMKNWDALVSHLKRFNTTRKSTLKIKELTPEVFEEFTYFLLDYVPEKKDRKNRFNYLTHDTVYKQIKKLRTFRNEYLGKVKKKKFPELVYNFPYHGTRNVIQADSLSSNELDALYYFDFANPKMQSAKLYFLLAFAKGGMRISDTISLVKNKDYKQDVVNYIQQKTGNEMYGGLLDAYFKRYLDITITPLKHYEINDSLKEIIELLAKKFNSDQEFRSMFTKQNSNADAYIREVKKKSYRGRSSTPLWSKPKPLSDVFSFKYARTTFISTSIFKYGMTKEQVMVYTGHSSEKVIDYYLDINKQREAFESGKIQIKPNDQYDIRLIQRLSDFSFLEAEGFFDLDTDEDLEFEARNIE